MRTELYHPLFSHFPIVFYVLAFLFKLALELPFFPKDKKLNIKFAFNIFFYALPLLYIVNFFLGDEALGIVKNKLCDINKLYRHEEDAFTMFYILLIIYLFELLRTFLKSKIILRVLVYIQLASWTFGFIYLIFLTHSGAMLVYDQGAAVKDVTAKCIVNHDQ